MITFLWLIRSFQGVSEPNDVNFWKFDWFVTAGITLMVSITDLLFTVFIYNIISEFLLK